MKIGISVTIDYECIVWLNSQKGSKSKAINELILGAIGGQSEELMIIKKISAQQGKAIKAYIEEIDKLTKDVKE